MPYNPKANRSFFPPPQGARARGGAASVSATAKRFRAFGAFGFRVWGLLGVPDFEGPEVHQDLILLLIRLSLGF